MSGEYQHKINKYSYYIYKVVSNKDLRYPLDIIETIKINDKSINNITKIKKYIKTRKKVL